jgi:phenylacetate-CoA ligase
MNIRKNAYFLILKAFRRINLRFYYDQYWQEDQNGIPPDTTNRLLIQLLTHCQQHVPFYSKIIERLGGNFHDDPTGYLQQFPVLTKKIIRDNFKDLQSSDLEKRKWFYMTSGGSTGEPGRVIQDYDFAEKAGAINLFFSKLVGRETGECEVYLWGSERDITHGSETWKARLANRLTNSIFVNAYHMSPQKMIEFVEILNTKKPKLIISYAESITSLAKYIEKENIRVNPQKAIITSAEALFPYMRETIERIFQCRVFNRYGSREIGNIACERPGIEGLWVAPWGNYLEILDSNGNRVPEGTDGEIVVTSLSNYAMPLLRYRIDDYGSLAPKNKTTNLYPAQVIQSITGRASSILKTKSGILVDSGYLQGLFYFRDWVKQYQIVQKNYSNIIYRVILNDHSPHQSELDEVISKTRLVFGDDCMIDFDFVSVFPSTSTSKHQFIISEIVNP